MVSARVYRRAGASLSKGLSRRRVMCALKRLSSSFLPGVDDTGGQPDGESPEGHGEDREAEDEPDVHAAERGLLVLGPLRLVVLLRLLDSALPALLHRASWHRRRLGEMRCLAGGATGKDRVGPGIARAANEARARGRTRATAPAGSIAATMRVAPACAACYERYARQAGVLMGNTSTCKKTWRKVPNFVYTDR